MLLLIYLLYIYICMYFWGYEHESRREIPALLAALLRTDSLVWSRRDQTLSLAVHPSTKRSAAPRLSSSRRERSVFSMKSAGRRQSWSLKQRFIPDSHWKWIWTSVWTLSDCSLTGKCFLLYDKDGI